MTYSTGVLKSLERERDRGRKGREGGGLEVKERNNKGGEKK